MEMPGQDCMELNRLSFSSTKIGAIEVEPWWWGGEWAYFSEQARCGNNFGPDVV
nr:hypothetical protein [uncultured bacterium]